MLESRQEWSDSFSDEDLQLLERVEAALPLVADVSRADVMLLVKDASDAIVVGQALPYSIATLYRAPWVGRRLPLNEDSLLAAGLNQGKRDKQQRNLLDQGTPIIQQVLPLISGSRRLPAVLQIETNLIAWERHKRRDAKFRRAVTWLQEMALRGDLTGTCQLSRFGERDGILYVDETFHICYLSGIANNLYRRLGYLDDLHHKHIGDLQTRDEELLRKAFAMRTCEEHQVLEGSQHWTRKVVPLWTYAPRWWSLPPDRWLFSRNDQQNPVLRGALVMVHDETEALRKAQELQVLATMIKEVHHRVKNNLQTVASILRMQARRVQTEEARLQLQEAVNRVLAVAVIHEFLSHDDEQSINIRDVCQRIVTQTQRAAMQPDKLISLRVQGPAIYLPSQQATACALVANELVLNALEHAFQDQENGSILLSVADEGDRVRLEVLDDGAGLPDSFSLPGADSLGLSIVRTLVEGDLKGTFALEPEEPGTRAIIVFDKSKPKD